MKAVLKRSFAVLLVAVMTFCALPVNASAMRCKHNKGTTWTEKADGTGHIKICNECGARLKTEDHDIFNDNDWTWTYYDADVIGGQPGEHAQICKKCGYTRWWHHSYVSKTWNLNGKAHPNVLVCDNTNCNHIKEFNGGNYDGYEHYHLYYTSYVNFDYHKTDCAYCGYTPTGHKPTQADYEKHTWVQCRNESMHWVECQGCHATYDKSGHSYETYTDDYQGWFSEKTKACSTCGWVKSIKFAREKTESGKWIYKEQLNSRQDIIDYNSGTVDIHYKEKPYDVEDNPCKHPIKAYEESTEENRYYNYIGGKHVVHCGSCGKALSTANCTFEIETYERVRRQYIEDRPWIYTDPDLGPDYVNYVYMEDYFKSGHYQVCTVCGGRSLVAHNWDNTNASHSTADSCYRTCKDCGFAMRYRVKKKETDPSPHTHLNYQDNYTIDANMNVVDPDDGCCSYTNSGTSHRAKCEYCGYEHTEHCDRLGWAELPGQPGKHLEFCSKCGGNKRVVDCGHKYVGAENSPAGFHAVECPTCGDVYIPKTPCDYVIDEKNTDGFIHTFKCSYCGFTWHWNHTRKTVKTNVVPATSTAAGHYDLVTYCEICNKEISRSTIAIPKTDNPQALGYVEGRYTFDTYNQAHMGSGSSFLNGTVVMDGVGEYLANHSAELLNGVTFNASHDFYVDGKHITANSSTHIVLIANLHMVVTDYTQDEDDLDGDDDRDEYTSMTATLSFTYSAYYVTTVNGTEYRDNTAVILNQPLDLTGEPITLTLPLLTGLISNQTMFVRQTTDGGATYATALGTFHGDWGLATCTFTTADGFDGSFLFLPTEHWLEHVERQEPTDSSDGNIEYWHDRGTDKYYSDILCEHEITRAQTYLNASTYTISFTAGEGGTGTAPQSITGVHKQQDVTLPTCTFTNSGYEFYGWYYDGWVYEAGSLFTVPGDAVLTAKWRLPGDTTVRVTFYPNAADATGTMDLMIAMPGDTLRLTENAFTREGWHFYGWSSDGTFQIPPYAFDRGTVAPDTDLDLYALWQPIYYITFDANGGEGTMEPQAYPATPYGFEGNDWYVQYQSLNPNTYTRDGYRFKGWSLNADGSGNLYSDGGVSPMQTTAPENYTLYAVWEKTRFTATFDKNAADATGTTESITFDSGVKIQIPQCGYEREGYVFVKWSASPTENTGVRNPGDVSLYSGDTTLYAVWAKTWTITFDKNDGSGETYSITVMDNEYDYLPYNEFVRDGYSPVSSYSFWNTAADGTGESCGDHGYKKWTSDATLYAQWKKTRFTVTYDPNGGEGEPVVQTVDFGATGLSSVCPRCTAAFAIKLTGPAMTVNYCNCCGFAVVNKEGGSTESIPVRNYASLADYTLYTKFDDLASLYAALLALYPDKQTAEVSDTESGEYAAYLALYDKAQEIMNASSAAVTKGLSHSLGTSAIVGVSDGYVITPGDYNYTTSETLGAIARLFGYSDAALFTTHLAATAQAYVANGAGAATDSNSNRLKYAGTVYTTNGSFVIPYAFRSDFVDETLLAYVIIDAEGKVGLWVSDLDALFYVTLYGLTLPEGVEGELETYGRCSLFEATRALENEFEKERYTFNKWNTSPDGTGTNYTPQSSTFSSSGLTADLVLYAQWKPAFHTLSFSANGGTGTMDPVVFDDNEAFTIPANTFTREGYVFAGWSTSATSTYASYTDEAELTRSADTLLYAVWKKAYVFTFDANGGYGFMDPQTIAEKTSTKLTPNAFLHDTKAFDYWSFTPDGAKAYSDNQSLYLSADPAGTTLYAIWKDKTDVSALITLADINKVYDGIAPEPEATIDFTGSGISASIYPGYTYAYFAGTNPSQATLLTAAPVDAGVYTVRAIYEDYRNKGFTDATLTITKAERNLSPASAFLLLYGKDKVVGLKVSDADGSALPENVAASAFDSSVVSVRAGESYKNGNMLLIAVAYEGEGYTGMTFTLPATANYFAATANITVISKNGYDVIVEETEGGTVTADKPSAPEGTLVTVSAVADPGWTLSRITLTTDNSYEIIEVTGGSFVMPEEGVTVNAEFTRNEYAITYAAVDGVTYSAGLPETAYYGERITVSAGVTGDRAIKAFRYAAGGTFVFVTPDENGAFTFDMPANDITVTAVTGDWYDVSVSGGITGGSLAVSASAAFEGMTVRVTPAPVAGYAVGAITYTAGGITKPVTVLVGENGAKSYSITMPAENITVSAEFIPDETLNGAIDAVGNTATSEKGKNEADLSIRVDAVTEAALREAVAAVDVTLTVSGSRNIADEEKAEAIGALVQAGLVNVENTGSGVSVKNTGDNSEAEIRIVEKTYVDVSVKEYVETPEGISMKLEITPMKQTVATSASEGTTLGSENSVPLSEAETVNVTAMTEVTVGIPADMALSAGGAGSLVYIGHSHSGVTYEYPAVIGGNATDGYTATFENPNGYSEFTVSAGTNTVASFVSGGVTYRYPSFSEAITEALKKDVTVITMHRMPTGEDYATVTKEVTFTFNAASGAETLIDFNALYAVWLTTDDGIRKSSTPAQLPLHEFVFVKTDADDDSIEALAFYGASLTLQNNLCVNYYVEKDLIVRNGYQAPYVAFEMNGDSFTVNEYREVTSGGVSYYAFSFSDVAPNLMNDTITATLHATLEGNDFASDPLDYSVATYCYAQLGITDNAELRTLLVDLLNYGAAAQVYTDYKTDDPVNKNLTDAEKAWGTASDPVLTSVLNAAYHTVASPEVNWYGASLNLYDSITMQFFFTAADTENLTVRIEDVNGTLLQEIAAADFVTSGSYKIAKYKGLNAGQMSETVYVTAYRQGTAVSNTVAYSIESYAYAKQNDADANLAALVKTLMKYGNAAYAYVH